MDDPKLHPLALTRVQLIMMGQILTAGLQILRKHHPDAHPNPNPVKLLSQELLALKMVPIMDIPNQFTKTMEV